MILRRSDIFASQLIADARDGLQLYEEIIGERLHGNVLDLGAHYGTFAIQAAEQARMYGDVWVLALEAAVGNYGWLLDNVTASGALGGVVPVHAAAYETDKSTVSLRRAANGNSGQHSTAFDVRHPVSDAAVPVMRLTDLLAMRDWAYVKVDVEGAEWSLLNQGDGCIPALMQRVRFLDLELHPLDNDEYYSDVPEVHQIPEVVDWFRKHDCSVAMTDRHPTRIFVVKGAHP